MSSEIKTVPAAVKTAESSPEAREAFLRPLADTLIQGIVKRALPASFPRAITSVGTTSADLSADYSFLQRQFFNNININPPTFAAAGTTTAFNTVTGAIAADSAVKRFARSSSVDHKWGRVESSIDALRGATQCAGGACYAAFRPLTIYSTVQGLDTSSAQASTLIGRVTFLTGAVGNAIFGVFYAAMTACCGVMFYRVYSFEKKLTQGRRLDKIDDPNQVEEIIKFIAEKRLMTTPQSTLQKLEKKYSNFSRAEREIKIKQTLSFAAKNACHEWIKQVAMECKKANGDNTPLKSEECDKIVAALFAELNQLDSIKAHLCTMMQIEPEIGSRFTFEELIGLDVLTRKREAKKQDKLELVLSSSVVSKCKEAISQGIVERLGSLDPDVQKAAFKEAQVLVKQMQEDLANNRVIYGLLTLSGLLGTVATILGFLVATPAVVITGGVMFLLCAVTMMVPDAMCMKQALQSEGKPGHYDKHVIYAGMTLCIISTIVIVVLSSVFSFGGVPAIIAFSIMFVWFINQCVALYFINKKEANYHKDHPTLEMIKEFLLKKRMLDPIDESTRALLKKLPKETQQMIKEQIALLKEVSLDRSVRTFIKEEDKELDKEFRFGEALLAQNPFDPDVVRALEKVLKVQYDLSLRTLLDKTCLQNITKEEDLAALKEQIAHVVASLRPDLFQKLTYQIYRERTRDAVGHLFASDAVHNDDLLAALALVIEEKKQVAVASESLQNLYQFLTYLRSRS